MTCPELVLPDILWESYWGPEGGEMGYSGMPRLGISFHVYYRTINGEKKWYGRIDGDFIEKDGQWVHGPFDSKEAVVELMREVYPVYAGKALKDALYQVELYTKGVAHYEHD